MSKIFIIIFRESLEVALLLGTVWAATANLPRAKQQITIGLFFGFIGSAILAFCTQAISNAFDGLGQEIFNIIILTISILMIGWTVIWMRERSKNIKNDLQQINTTTEMKFVLPLMVATFIFREGTEIVLFIYGILMVEHLSSFKLLASLIGGGISGLIVGIVLYQGLTKFSGRRLFKVTSFLFILIAASLSTEVANLLNSIDILSSLGYTLWDSSKLISDTSITGRILNTLIGYQAKPTLLQVIFYLITITTIIIIDKNYNNQTKKLR